MKPSMMPSVQTPIINPALKGFGCLRCSHEIPVGDWFEGCPQCLSRGQPTSLRPMLEKSPSKLGDPHKSGLWRYSGWLPYLQGVTLGEGNTSTIDMQVLARDLGLRKIGLKNEGQNPSGSHKDRMSCLVVTRALDMGAKKVVAASSGNAGASIALYAAAAGLECSVICTPAVSSIFRRAITMTGAQVLTVEASAERWDLMAEMVTHQGWFPATNYLNPPVGSNPFGVDGLKSIAFELFEAGVTASLDAIVVPTSRGDLLWGIYRGFVELREAGLVQAIPRLYAVEPFPRIAQVLEGAHPQSWFPGETELFSIGGATVAYQALAAIEGSGGGAIVVDDAAVERDQITLARNGCFAELSSAATLTGLRRLLDQGRIRHGESVVLIATAHGYKELPGTGRTK
ncbi:MAG: pyridoxal-phosphate dependent enzyme [Pseudomonadota bacterium]|nr:pyridoxal-phosphate dependent enzyme [Pseudomonadota bacterium]